MVMPTSSHEWDHECVIAKVQGNVTPDRVSRFSTRFFEHFLATRKLFGEWSGGRNKYPKRSACYYLPAHFYTVTMKTRSVPR